MIVLNDTRPAEPKALIERQVKKPSAAPTDGAQQQHTQPQQAPFTPQQDTRNTQNDAAAVLNAVDEDEEGVAEAECPREFEYESDGEGGDD